MSIVTYNGITLPYALTTDFRVTPIADEVGNTDWYCSRYTINVQCLIGIDYLRAIDPNLVAADAPSIMNGIKHRLQQRRKLLSFSINGIEQIPQRQQGLPALPATDAVDVSNGPIPLEVKVIDLTYGNFLLNFAIQADYWNKVNTSEDVNGPNERGNPVLYNRWKEIIEIDDRNYSRRTREGKYRIRSDNFQGQIADQFRRDLAVVSIPNGFLRKSAKYTQTPDGLGLEYHIVDEEVYKLPPAPAFKAQGSYTEEVTRGGVNRYCEVNVRLEGDKITDQEVLARTCWAICVTKLNANGAFLGEIPNNLPPPGPGERGGGGGPFLLARFQAFLVAASLGLLRENPRGARLSTNGAVLEGSIIKVNMYDNVVECKMRAFTNFSRDRINRAQGYRRGLSFTPLSSDGGLSYTPAYLDRGTASILLQAAAYWDPSILNVTLGPGTTTAAGEFTRTGDSAVQHTRGRIPGTEAANPNV